MVLGAGASPLAGVPFSYLYLYLYRKGAHTDTSHPRRQNGNKNISLQILFSFISPFLFVFVLWSCVCVWVVLGGCPLPPAPSLHSTPSSCSWHCYICFLTRRSFFFLDILQRCWRKSAFICMHGYALYLSACLALILGVLLVLASQDAFVPPRFPLLPLFPPFP